MERTFFSEAGEDGMTIGPFSFAASPAATSHASAETSLFNSF